MTEQHPEEMTSQDYLDKLTPAAEKLPCPHCGATSKKTVTVGGPVGLPFGKVVVGCSECHRANEVLVEDLETTLSDE